MLITLCFPYVSTTPRAIAMGITSQRGYEQDSIWLQRSMQADKLYLHMRFYERKQGLMQRFLACPQMMHAGVITEEPLIAVLWHGKVT